MKTDWNFKLFYKSDSDPQILKDIDLIKKSYNLFEKKYKNKTDYLKSDKALLKILKELETLSLKALGKPLHFWSLKLALNSSDSETEAKLNKYSNELAHYENKVLFFDLRLGKISKVQQKKFLKSKVLAPYNYYLKKLFETSKYDLSEPEEKILNLKSLPSYSLWVQGVEKLVNKQTILFKGKNISIGEAQNILSDLPTQDRRELWKLIMECFYNISDFAESEMNAIVINKKITDELRKRKTPYEATISAYQNDPKVIENLVSLVTKSFPVSHRFYNLKKRLLNLDKLNYADRSAKVGSIDKKYSFKESVDIFRESLKPTGEKYLKILDSFIENGHIDVYPKQGKDTGAFCSSSVSIPTLVLLNHTGTFRSVTTLAHEMGHAFHAEIAKSQPPFYQGHSTSVAETASTFFENFVFEELFKGLSEEEKVVALHDQINDDISTVFRQIAFFNFEKELHFSIREKGSVSKEEIAKILNSHMQSYLGPSFTLDPKDGYFFVTVSHFRRFFYVYAYAFGQLTSRALYQRFKQNPTFFVSVEKFLSAGASDTPENIFKKCGINLKDPDFFKEGIKLIDKNIDRLEKLVARKK